MQSNFAKEHRLESDIQALKHEDMSIKKFCFAMMNLLGSIRSLSLNNYEHVHHKEKQQVVLFFYGIT